MPVEAGTLVTSYKADTRDLERGAERAERRVVDSAGRMRDAMGRFVGDSNRAAGGFLSTLSNISNVIQALPAVGQIAHTIVSPLTDAARTGLQFNATLESAKIGFEGIAGGAQGAQKHLDRLLAFAEKTPFEFTGLLKSSRYMSVFGFQIDEHIPKLTAWGNAIAATGDISEEVLMGVVRAFGQMSAKGKVSAEEMEQLAERGIPSWELLAKAIGKTVGETRKLSEMGRLKGGPAVEAITAMMEIDPRYKDQMARQSQTFAGRISNYQDLYARSTGMATQGLFDEINKTMEAGLKQSGMAETMAQSINTAITPVAGMVRIAAVGLLGGGITEGLSEGIKAGQTIVSQAVENLGLGVITTFAKRLGIESPSKVFYDFGLLSAEGFALGLKAGLQQQDPTEELGRLLEDPRVRALLDVIKRAEGGGVATLYGGQEWQGGMDEFPPWSGKRFWNKKKGKYETTHAAGLYQFQPGTYEGIGREFSLPRDFSERTQDLHAVGLLKKLGALDALFSKGFGATIPLLGAQWASIPGPLGGPTDAKFNPRTLEKMYAEALGDPSLLTGMAQQGGSQRALEIENQLLKLTTERLNVEQAYNKAIADRMNEPGPLGQRQPGNFAGNLGAFDVRLPLPDSSGIWTGKDPAILAGAVRSQQLERLAADRDKRLEELDGKIADLKIQLEAAKTADMQEQVQYSSAETTPGLPAAGMFDVNGPALTRSPFGPPNLEKMLFQGRLSLFNIADTLGPVPKLVGEIDEAFQKAKPGAGEWFKLVAGGGMNLRKELNQILGSIPPIKEQFKGLIKDLPEGMGGIFGDAVRQWDGDFSTLFQNIGLNFADLLSRMSAQLASSAISKLLTALIGAVLGGLGGSFDIPKLSSSSTDTSIGFNPGPLPSFAIGGDITPFIGEPIQVHADEKILPLAPGYVVPKGGMKGGNTFVTINVPVARSSGYTQPRNRRQLAEDIWRRYR